MSDIRREARLRRHKRLRKHLSGTSQSPRLCVYRSLRNLSAQLVDDIAGKTLLSASTLDKGLKNQQPKGGNLKAAQALGELISEKAAAKGIKSVIFDRGGYAYHGRVKAFADGARKAGLQF